ncbi:hypothetical protein CRE_26467 [Caenorhabditis remanei]|uniref:Uncharacterized protein n=2 Tax=Caenorhabditis remanei TaxID=31234 RepID=E3LQP1_CAERE|nr:hypothetical protein CRE_26467 [Caenorhabditis remanei]
MPKNNPHDMIEVMKGLLKFDEKDRLTAQQVLHSRWISRWKLRWDEESAQRRVSEIRMREGRLDL